MSLKSIYICLLFLAFFVQSSFGQNLETQLVGIFPELSVNQGFPVGNDLISFNKSELYWIHSNGRPMGLENDSLDLFLLKDSSLQYLQTLETPIDRTIGKLTGFGLTDSFLFFTDNNVVLIYEKISSVYELKEVVDAVNTYDILSGKYGSFEDWIETKDFIYTTDFHVDKTCDGGCKNMFIGKIDKVSLQLVDSFTLKTCGNIMAQMNSHVPIDFSPSGNLMARVDLPSNRLEVYKPGVHELTQVSTFERDSLYPNAIDSDSLSIWTEVHQFGPQKVRQEYWQKIQKEVFSSDQISGIKFLTDSMLLLRSVRSGVLHFDLLNVHNHAFIPLNIPPELIGQRWDNHMMCVRDGRLYVLFPNIVIEEKRGAWKQEGETIKTIQGWRLIEVSIHE